MFTKLIGHIIIKKGVPLKLNEKLKNPCFWLADLKFDFCWTVTFDFCLPLLFSKASWKSDWLSSFRTDDGFGSDSNLEFLLMKKEFEEKIEKFVLSCVDERRFAWFSSFEIEFRTSAARPDWSSVFGMSFVSLQLYSFVRLSFGVVRELLLRRDFVILCSFVPVFTLLTSTLNKGRTGHWEYSSYRSPQLRREYRDLCCR